MADDPDQPEPPSADSDPPGGFDADNLVRRHGASASIGRMLNLVGASASVVVVARLLDPEDFGQFVVVRTALSVLGMVAAFGLGTTALRLLGPCLTDDTPHRRRAILITIGQIAAITSLAVALLGTIGSLLFGEQYLNQPVGWQIAIIVGIGAIASSGLALIADGLRGVGLPGPASLLGNVRGQGSAAVHLATIVVLATVALFTHPTWQEATAVYVVAMCLVVIVGIVYLVRSQRDHSTVAGTVLVDSSATTGKMVLAMSWPVAITSVLAYLTTSCDLFLTSSFAETDGVGPYVGARRVIMLLSIPMSILNQTSRGIINPLQSNQMHDRLEQVLRAGVTLITVPCLVAGTALLLVPGLVLRIVLGPGYDDAALLLQILVPGQIVFVMTGACGPMLELSGHQRTIMIIDGLTFIVMIFGGWWVSTIWGAIGLATLFSASTAARNLALWEAARRMTGINTAFGFGALPRWRTFLDQYRAVRRSKRAR